MHAVVLQMTLRRPIVADSNNFKDLPWRIDVIENFADYIRENSPLSSRLNEFITIDAWRFSTAN